MVRREPTCIWPVKRRKIGPANKSLEIIARLTYDLEPAEREEIPRITKVIYNLGVGSVDDDQTGVVDARGCTVLPHGDEGLDTET